MYCMLDLLLVNFITSAQCPFRFGVLIRILAYRAGEGLPTKSLRSENFTLFQISRDILYRPVHFLHQTRALGSRQNLGREPVSL